MAHLDSSGRTVRATRLWGTAALLALFAAAMWVAWLGWDHEYYQVDGVPQGPYRAWQVIGCGLTIAVATLVASWWTPRPVATVLLAGAAVVGFAVPWAVDAARTDETGLWAAGLFLLVAGGFVGLLLLLAVFRATVLPGGSPRRALVVCGVVTVLLLLVSPPAAVVPLLLGGWVLLRRWLPQRRTTQA